MARIDIVIVSIVLGLTACEKRKATLLPPKDLSQEQAKEKAGEMRARAVPESIENPMSGEATVPLGTNDVDELEQVKEEALKRIRGIDKKKSAAARASTGKGKRLFDRGRSLVTQGHFDDGIQLFLAACQEGFSEGCHRFGWHEERSGNTANARQFYRIACDAGLNKSCNNLGVQYEQQKKWEEALDFYARACLNQHDVSCANLKRLRNQRLKVR
jgi:tetratricopeptide (TPR) repeat protein